MNENQHSITVLFNPAPDPQEKKRQTAADAFLRHSLLLQPAGWY